MALGETVLPAGHRLRPQDVGAAALMGHDGLAVFEPLRVALMSTGDEIVEPGQPLHEGGLYDANRHILAGLLARLPVRVTDLGCLPDDRSCLEAVLAEAAATHHLVLTSGGASQGEEDHLAACLSDIGRLRFWRIALKPGRPLAMGEIGDCLIVGLPGNPVAASLCFAYLARPLLLALAGAPWHEPERMPLPLEHTLRKKPGRTELVRARLVETPEGRRLRKVRKEGSGVLTSLVEARGVIELGPETRRLEAGDVVPFLPFECLDLG